MAIEKNDHAMEIIFKDNTKVQKTHSILHLHYTYKGHYRYRKILSMSRCLC